MPTSRGVGSWSSGLGLAAALADEHGCPLIIIASGPAATAVGRAHIETVVEQGASRRLCPIIVDVSDIDVLALGFRADLSCLAKQAWSRWPGRGDTALKRNFGILLARRAGWRRVLFLDDDIRATSGGGTGAGLDLNARNLGVVMGALDRYRAVGWVATAGAEGSGYADNSVICHIRRSVGYAQGVFLGGGALGIRVDDETPHFPRIYNEDWLFCIQLLLRFGRAALAIAGEVTQDLPERGVDETRAAMEERGDILAEALMNLMNRPRRFHSIAQSAYFWRQVIVHRVELVRTLTAITLEQVRPGGIDPLDRASLTLQATQQAQKELIGDLNRSAGHFCSYVRAWMADGRRWAKHLEEAGSGRLPEAMDQVVRWQATGEFLQRPGGGIRPPAIERPLTVRTRADEHEAGVLVTSVDESVLDDRELITM